MMEDSEESSGQDFSTSEDDWKPPKDQSDSSDFEVSVGKMENSSTSAQLLARKKKRISRNGRGTPNPTSTSLRSRLYQESKNPPKLSSLKINENTFSGNKNVKKRKIREDRSDSSSSGDDYLVDPNDLDLKSSFFDVNVPEPSRAPVQIEQVESGPSGYKKDGSSELINKISSDVMDNLQDYCQTIEDAKLHLKNYKSESLTDNTFMDVHQLLAMGEGTSNNASTSTHKKRNEVQNYSDSDWDEVEDIEECNDSPLKNVSVDGLQITVQTMQTAKKKDTNCIDAMLKRKINRVIKENQIYLHKSSLLCHIAHGIYCNKILNIPSLMSKSLKLLPNGSNSYPNGRTEIKYFESMVKWYATAVTLKNEVPHTNLKKPIKLKESLKLQIQNKAANSKKDFVLIFIILLRAMGIQCRLVLNLVPLPLRPTQNDLCSLKQDKKPDTKKTEKSKKLTVKTSEVCSSPKVAVNTKTKEKTITTATTMKKVTVPQKQKLSTKEGDQQKTKDKNVSDGKNIKNLNLNAKTIDKPKNKDNTVKVASKITAKDVPVKKYDPVKKQPQEAGLRTCHPQTSTEGSKLSLSSIGKRKSINISKLTACANKKETTTEKGNSQKEKCISPHFMKSDTNMEQPTVTRRTTRSKAKLLAASPLESIPQLDGNDEITELTQSRPVRKKINLKTLKVKPQMPAKDSEDEFVPSPPKKLKLGKSATLKRLDRRVLSTDVDEKETKPRKKGMDVWVEVFSETEEKWVSIDLFKSKVHCVDNIRKAATLPIAYVFAWNNDNSLKDVSARYCLQWHTVTRKQRVDQSWLEDAIEGYRGIKNSRDFAEDRELHKLHLDKPLPTTISEYKNHPLYVIQRHLLKFEGIYPPNALTLGFIRGEPVYSRDCVHTLHSREIWLKSARVVKPKEEPYKIVKSRPKWDKYSNTVIKDQPLEIFGYWQTMDYVPPTAENGIVPRNAYGNVELFKKCMLPKKTVHLQLPGLAKICKKLDVDCAPAVIGFDFHAGSCHPMLDGFVICEEFADTVIAAWNQYQDDMAKREEEKYQQRVYGNWKKLIKGLFIREKLKRKYNFQGAAHSDGDIKEKKKK